MAAERTRSNTDNCINKYTIIGDELTNLPSFTVVKIPDQKLMECLSPTDIFELIESKSTSFENDVEGYHLAEKNRLHLYGNVPEEAQKIPIFKLPNSGILVIALPTLLLRYRLLVLTKLGKFRVGTYIGISRTHGNEETLYTPIPVDDIGKKHTSLTLSMPNKEVVFSRYAIEEDLPQWKKDRLESLNDLPIPERVVFKQSVSGVLKGIITEFSEIGKQGIIKFGIDTMERRITGTESFEYITMDELQSRGFCADDIPINTKAKIIFDLILAHNIDAICIKDDDELIKLLVANPTFSTQDDDTDGRNIMKLMSSKRARTMDVNFRKLESDMFSQDDGRWLTIPKFHALIFNKDVFEYLFANNIRSQMKELLHMYLSLDPELFSQEDVNRINILTEKIKSLFPQHKKMLILMLQRYRHNLTSELTDLLNSLLRELTYEDVFEEKVEYLEDFEELGKLIKILVPFGRIDLAERILLFLEQKAGTEYPRIVEDFFNDKVRYSDKHLRNLKKVLLFLLRIGKIDLIKYVKEIGLIKQYLFILFGQNSIKKFGITDEEEKYIESKYEDILKVIPIDKVTQLILKDREEIISTLEMLVSNKKLPNQFLKTLLKTIMKDKDGKEIVCELLEKKRSKFEPSTVEESSRECEEKKDDTLSSEERREIND